MRPFGVDSLASLFDKHLCVCSDCYGSFNPKWTKFKLEGIPVLALFDYDPFIKEKLFLLKGCHDYELAPIFLDRHRRLLKLMYKRYRLVPIPSWHEDDERRGFNHVEAIFATLHLPILHLLEKSEPYKQSDRSYSQRDQIKKVLRRRSNNDITGRSILIVDDVMTSGSSVRAAIELLKPLRPRRIRVLVIARTIAPETST